MKKLSLTGAALLCFAALTHAQINQVGASQYAEQNRTGNNQTGTISQVQAQSNADRTNFGNYAITFQTAPGDGGTNTANVNQNNGSQGNRAGITQQGGASNLAQIDQNGGSSGLSGGASSISATIGQAGELGNFAGIAQQGSNNTAYLSQSNLSQQNGSEIYQNGTSNAAVVEQNDNSLNNLAFVFQGYTGQGQPGSAVSNARATISQNGPNAQYGGAGLSARNTATVIQTASDVQAEIQQGNFSARSASLFGTPPTATSAGQSTDNLASIEQQSQSNGSSAIIRQGIGQGLASGSSAYVVQTNVFNTATVYQGINEGSDYGSTARVTQSRKGFENTAYVFDNRVQLLQGAYSGMSYSNQAIITQGGTLDGNGRAYIAQGIGAGATSARNQVIITQLGRATIPQNAGISINQGVALKNGTSTGQDNQASVFQGEGVTNGTLRIDQGALFSYAVIGNVTAIEANRNVASINQVRGTNVQARIGQGTNSASYADGNPPPQSLTFSLSGSPFELGNIARDNRADITQAQGDGNYSLILQSGEQNIGRITQQAQDNNFAIIVQTQNANRAIATINQLDGSANRAIIQQFGSADGNVSIGTADQAIINQFRGSNNVAFLQQGAPGVSASGGNYAILTQNGNSNQARFLQQGVGNFVSITQNGDGNEIRNGAGDANSYGSQVGNNNSLRLIQNGGSNRIFSYTQVGNNNTQVVSQ